MSEYKFILKVSSDIADARSDGEHLHKTIEYVLNQNKSEDIRIELEPYVGNDAEVKRLERYVKIYDDQIQANEIEIDVLKAELSTLVTLLCNGDDLNAINHIHHNQKTLKELLGDDVKKALEGEGEG